MNLDPMTSEAQAVAEQTEREDERAREQAWAEAQTEAALEINRFYDRRVPFASDAPAWERQLEAAESLLAGANLGYGSKALQAFASDYGVPALLAVIGRALQA